MIRNQLIFAHYPMVQRLAFGIATRAGRRDLFGDLMQEGAVALIEAIDEDLRFNMTRTHPAYDIGVATAMMTWLYKLDVGALYNIKASCETARAEREEC